MDQIRDFTLAYCSIGPAKRMPYTDKIKRIWPVYLWVIKITGMRKVLTHTKRVSSYRNSMITSLHEV